MSETRPPSQLTSPSISAPGGALRQRRKRNRGYAIHQTTPAGEAGGSSFEEEALVKLQPVVLDQLADFVRVSRRRRCDELARCVSAGNCMARRGEPPTGGGIIQSYPARSAGSECMSACFPGLTLPG